MQKLRRVLRTMMWIAIGVALVVAIGLSAEWIRRHRLQSLAQELGGTFETGDFLNGAPLPEAAPFESHPRPDSITYRNVIRMERGSARYAAADYHRSSSSRKSKGSSYLVVFLTFPEADFPDFDVWPPMDSWSQSMASKLGFPERPAKLRVPDEVTGFSEIFEVRPASAKQRPDTTAVARFLPPAVQEELLRSREFLTGLQTRSNAVYLQAQGRVVQEPYQEMLGLAERLVAIWLR